MSDFDMVLERLVTDPGFARALAADPSAALTGYRLDPDEVELLRSQVSAGDSGGRTVETRTSKAGIAGLLAPLSGLGLGGAEQHFAGSAGAEQHLGGGGAGPHPHSGFGPNVRTGLAPLDSGEGSNPYANPYDSGPAAGEAVRTDLGDQPATGYHARVDADGDGRWDQYTAVRHADGGVDVYVDRNRDGRIDFAGHDANGDGILESADYDQNFDGAADTRMEDRNGDGWMDTRRETGR